MNGTISSSRERVSTVLWELHEAAMDASNDPTRKNVNRVHELYSRLRRVLPQFRYEETQALFAKDPS